MSPQHEPYPWEPKGARQVQVPYQVQVDFFQHNMSISKFIHYVFPKCAIKTTCAYFFKRYAVIVCVCVLVWGLRFLTTWIVTPRAGNPLSAGLWHDLEAACCLLPLCVTPISYIARTRRYPFKSTRFRPYLQLQ